MCQGPRLNVFVRQYTMILFLLCNSIASHLIRPSPPPRRRPQGQRPESLPKPQTLKGASFLTTAPGITDPDGIPAKETTSASWVQAEPSRVIRRAGSTLRLVWSQLKSVLASPSSRLRAVDQIPCPSPCKRARRNSTEISNFTFPPADVSTCLICECLLLKPGREYQSRTNPCHSIHPLQCET